MKYVQSYSEFIYVSFYDPVTQLHTWCRCLQSSNGEYLWSFCINGISICIKLIYLPWTKQPHVQLTHNAPITWTCTCTKNNYDVYTCLIIYMSWLVLAADTHTVKMHCVHVLIVNLQVHVHVVCIRFSLFNRKPTGFIITDVAIIMNRFPSTFSFNREIMLYEIKYKWPFFFISNSTYF